MINGEQDILDQYALGQIDRREAVHLLTDLYRDWYDANATIRLADELPQTN